MSSAQHREASHKLKTLRTTDLLRHQHDMSIARALN
jgi:hypothetical protein